MAISAQKSQGKERELAPKGRQQAVLCGIKDEGMHPNTFKDGNPLEPKLSFVFEIALLNSEGERHSFSVWKTNSSFFSKKNGKMSGLMEMLTQWLDVPAGEITPSLLDDLELLCGLNASVRLVHEPKQDGSGDKCKMSIIEPFESAELLEPSREWGDSGFFPSKTLEQFWAQVKSNVPSNEKASAPKTKPAQTPAKPLEPTEGEKLISGGLIAQIKTEGRAKLGSDGEPLIEMCFDGFSKKLSMLSADEGAKFLDQLRKLKDFKRADEAESDEETDIFDDESEATDEEATRMLLQDAPAPAVPARKGKAASEAY